MRIKEISVSHLCLVLAMSVTFVATGSSEPLKTDHDERRVPETHAAGFRARVTLPNGAIRTIDLQGVGCSAAMCSRVFIRAKADSHLSTRVWLDSIAAIKGVSADGALFVMRDGTERQLSFIPDFRVLYIAAPNAGAEKLDLGTIKSLDFLPSAK